MEGPAVSFRTFLPLTLSLRKKNQGAGESENRKENVELFLSPILPVSVSPIQVVFTAPIL